MFFKKMIWNMKWPFLRDRTGLNSFCCWLSKSTSLPLSQQAFKITSAVGHICKVAALVYLRVCVCVRLFIFLHPAPPPPQRQVKVAAGALRHKLWWFNKAQPPTRDGVPDSFGVRMLRVWMCVLTKGASGGDWCWGCGVERGGGGCSNAQEVFAPLCQIIWTHTHTVSHINTLTHLHTHPCSYTHNTLTQKHTHTLTHDGSWF